MTIDNFFSFNFLFQAYRDLSFVSRDGLTLVVNKVQQILTEKFQRLLDSPKAQVKSKFIKNKGKDTLKLLVKKNYEHNVSTQS